MVELPGVDPKMIANNIEPAFATHPGSILKDEIEYTDDLPPLLQ